MIGPTVLEKVAKKQTLLKMKKAFGLIQNL